MSEQDAKSEQFDCDLNDQARKSVRWGPKTKTIPGDWGFEPIHEHSSEIIYPQRDKPTRFDGDIPWVRIEDLNGVYISGPRDGKRYVSRELMDEMNLRSFPEGTLMCSCSTTMGVCAITTRELLSNQTFAGIVTEDSTNTHYLYYAITNCAEELDQIATGSTISYLSSDKLENFHVPLPPLEEQRKIASVLYTVDQAIQQTETVIEQVRTVKQGVLQDMMKGRGSDKPLEEKRVGPRTVLLPKDWEIVQIGDALERDIILKQQDGNHGSDYPRKDEFVDQGVPYLSAEMLSEGQVDFSQAKYLTEERANQLRIGFAQDGDVLLAHNATVGPAGLLKTDRDLIIIGTSLTYYRCDLDKLDNKYLTYFFQSETFQKQLQDVMRQSTRNQVPITRQRNLHLILPPVEEQRKISGRIDTIIERMRRESDYHERLQRLKRGLMQDLLSGEVRTHDKNIEVVDEVLAHG